MESPFLPQEDGAKGCILRQERFMMRTYPDWFPFYSLQKKKSSQPPSCAIPEGSLTFPHCSSASALRGMLVDPLSASPHLAGGGVSTVQQLQLITGPHCPCNSDFLTTVQLRGKPPLWPFRTSVGKEGHQLGWGWAQAPVLRRAQGGWRLCGSVQDTLASAAGVSGRPQSRGGAKAALSSCPFPMRAGSSQGTPLGNGRGAPGLRGQRRSWREESLGASAGLQPGPRAQPPRQWRPSVRCPRAGDPWKRRVRAQGRQHRAAWLGRELRLRDGPREGGSGGARPPAAQAQQPLGPSGAGRASSPGERERGEAGVPPAGQRWGRASLTSRADFTAEPPRSPKKAL